MLEEAGILDGDDCIDQVSGDLFVGDVDAVGAGDDELLHDAAVGRIDDALVLLGLQVADGLDDRSVADDLRVGADRYSCPDDSRTDHKPYRKHDQEHKKPVPLPHFRRACTLQFFADFTLTVVHHGLLRNTHFTTKSGRSP